MRNKEQIKADNLAILPSLLEMGATYYGGIDAWTARHATMADGLSYLSFPVVEIARPATAEEMQYGCEYYEDCPCCKCGEDVATIITYNSYRWSNSGKSVVEDNNTAYVCVAHA
jgi:hypothetical protein